MGQQHRVRRRIIEVEDTEIVELEANRFIQLEKYRQWPKLGVAWSLRQRSGESDFPLTSGSVDRLPKADEDPETVWSELREVAVQQADEAAQSTPAPPDAAPRRSLLSRLLGR